jgi:hypothetical protein
VPASIREPNSGAPKRQPSSSAKAITASRSAPATPLRPQVRDGGERGHHAERAVERPAVGHGVEVRAGRDEPVRRRVRVRQPEVAGSVVLRLGARLRRRRR